MNREEKGGMQPTPHASFLLGSKLHGIHTQNPVLSLESIRWMPVVEHEVMTPEAIMTEIPRHERRVPLLIYVPISARCELKCACPKCDL